MFCRTQNRQGGGGLERKGRYSFLPHLFTVFPPIPHKSPPGKRSLRRRRVYKLNRTPQAQEKKKALKLLVKPLNLFSVYTIQINPLNNEGKGGER